VSIENAIETLEKLVAADDEIKTLTDAIEQEQGALDGIRKELADLEERLAADRERVSEMDKTRNDLVQEMRQISGQIDRSRERLQRARNEREAQAAERELDELRKIQRDRDDEVKKLGELSEQARTSIQEAETRKAELDERLSGSLAGTTDKITALETELSGKREARNALSKDMPSIVFRRYERLLSRGRSPVAKTTDGTCLGCFVKLPPMLFHQMLSRRQFEECPNCHRIIYYEPPPTEEELAAAAAEAAKADAADAGDEGSADAAAEQASGDASS
jgi:predicted  nucleic acid-binding Zn-ribbon protein